jgi:hypothetical protein
MHGREEEHFGSYVDVVVARHIWRVTRQDIQCGYFSPSSFFAVHEII